MKLRIKSFRAYLLIAFTVLLLGNYHSFTQSTDRYWPSHRHC